MFADRSTFQFHWLLQRGSFSFDSPPWSNWYWKCFSNLVDSSNGRPPLYYILYSWMIFILIWSIVRREKFGSILSSFLHLKVLLYRGELCPTLAIIHLVLIVDITVRRILLHHYQQAFFVSAKTNHVTPCVLNGIVNSFQPGWHFLCLSMSLGLYCYRYIINSPISLKNTMIHYQVQPPFFSLFQRLSSSLQFSHLSYEPYTCTWSQ